jgi:hypothetical protein
MLWPRNPLSLDISHKATSVPTCITERTPPSSLLVNEPGGYKEELVDVMNFPRCYLLYNIAVLLKFDTLRSL